jgi:hypothetical protein
VSRVGKPRSFASRSTKTRTQPPPGSRPSSGVTYVRQCDPKQSTRRRNDQRVLGGGGRSGDRPASGIALDFGADGLNISALCRHPACPRTCPSSRSVAVRVRSRSRADPARRGRFATPGAIRDADGLGDLHAGVLRFRLSISRLNIARALGEYFLQSVSASAKSWPVVPHGVSS